MSSSYEVSGGTNRLILTALLRRLLSYDLYGGKNRFNAYLRILAIVDAIIGYFESLDEYDPFAYRLSDILRKGVVVNVPALQFTVAGRDGRAEIRDTYVAHLQGETLRDAWNRCVAEGAPDGFLPQKTIAVYQCAVALLTVMSMIPPSSVIERASAAATEGEEGGGEEEEEWGVKK